VLVGHFRVLAWVLVGNWHVIVGYLRGTRGVLAGNLRGTRGYSQGTRGMLAGYSGVLAGSSGVLRPRARLPFGAIGFRWLARALWPQVSPGPAAPTRRNGLAECTTRRWSMPPAPSTSSAAAMTAPAASPTSGTFGRAPTDVRGPDCVKAGACRGTKRYRGVLEMYLTTLQEYQG
jgi:hypothetical protein